MPRLNKRLVDGLPSGDRDRYVFDTDLSGFAVRVWPSGKKVYYVQYRAGRRLRRVKVGAHGHLTVEEARKQARALLGDIARGEDPAEERKTRRKSLTVSELCDRYMEAADRGLIIGKRGLPKKSSTLSIDRGRIARHIKPLLGKRLVIDLRRSDVDRFVRDVTSGKTAQVIKTDRPRGKSVVKGGPGTAARTAGLLGSIMSFAVRDGVIDVNPVAGVALPTYGHRDRRLAEDEYRRLGAALTDIESETEPPQALHCIWLLALTGCRKGEIVGLRWDEVDEEGGCFRLSDSKTGAAIRPIGRPAFDLLAGIPARDGNPHVLPAVRSPEGPYGSAANAWRRIASRAEISDATIHTLRHSFASVAADIGFTDGVIGSLLGHASRSTVTSRYVHRLDSVLVAAANKVAGTIHGWMVGEQATVLILPVRSR